MGRLYFLVFAAFSAGTAGIAYVLGIIQLGEWVWGIALLAEESRWYGIQDIPVLRELLALLFAFAVYFGGVYVFVILPVLVVSFVYEGVKRFAPVHDKQ